MVAWAWPFNKRQHLLNGGARPTLEGMGEVVRLSRWRREAGEARLERHVREAKHMLAAHYYSTGLIPVDPWGGMGASSLLYGQVKPALSPELSRYRTVGRVVFAPEGLAPYPLFFSVMERRDGAALVRSARKGEPTRLGESRQWVEDVEWAVTAHEDNRVRHGLERLNSRVFMAAFYDIWYKPDPAETLGYSKVPMINALDDHIL